MDYFIERLILFLFGGVAYCYMELVWRGYSHILMLILGGVCFLIIGSLGRLEFKYRKSFLFLQILATVAITSLEFIFGLIFNLGLGLKLWDYSNLSFNLLGQISLRYSIYWFFLSLPALLLYDYLVYWLFEGERPKF